MQIVYELIIITVLIALGFFAVMSAVILHETKFIEDEDDDSDFSSFF